MPENISVSTKPHTFVILDALRGIAAISVVIGHMNGLLGRVLFAHAYLAVDFFFMLSGFILAYAYQQRLDDGMPAWQFIKARIFRLYPLYLLGTVLGFIYSVVTLLHAGKHDGPHYIFLFVFALLFLPAPVPANYPGMTAFPFNPFAWSLFYELFANIVHVTLLRRRSATTVLIAAGVAGLVFFLQVSRRGHDAAGILTRDLPFGITKVIFAYLVGLLLFRLWHRHRDHYRISPAWCVLLLVAALFVPGIEHGNARFDILIVLFVMPAIVLLGAFSHPSPFARPVAKLLGVVSYAIYILSSSLILYLLRAWEYIFRKSPHLAVPWSGIAFVIIILATAWIADLVYDLPIRRWLRIRFAA